MGRWELPDPLAGGAMFFSFVNPPLFPLPLPHHRFGSVPPDGQHHSPIKNKSGRFNAMLEALTPSRLAVTFQAIGTMKVADAHLTYLTVHSLHVPGVIIPGAELPEPQLV